MNSLFTSIGKLKPRGLLKPRTSVQRRFITRQHMVEHYGHDSYEYNFDTDRFAYPEKAYNNRSSMEQDLKDILMADIPLNTLREIGQRELKGKELEIWENNIKKLERKLEWSALAIAKDLQSDILPDVSHPLQFPDWVTAVEFLLNASAYHQIEKDAFYLRSKDFESPSGTISSNNALIEQLFEENDTDVAHPTSIFEHPRFTLGKAGMDLTQVAEVEEEVELIDFSHHWHEIRGHNLAPFLTEKYTSHIQFLLKKVPELRLIIKDFTHLITGVSEGYKDIDEMIDAISHYNLDGHFDNIKGVNISFIYHLVQLHRKLESHGNEQQLTEHKNIMKCFGLLPKAGPKFRHVRKLFSDIRKDTFSLAEKESIRQSFKTLLGNPDALKKEHIYHLNELARIIRSGELGDDTLTILDGSIESQNLPATPEYWKRHSDRTALTWEILTKKEKKNDDYVENKVEYLITPRIILYFDELAASGDFVLMRNQLEKSGMLNHPVIYDVIEDMLELKKIENERSQVKKEMETIKSGLEYNEINGDRIYSYRTKKGDVYAANFSLLEEKIKLRKTIHKQDVLSNATNAVDTTTEDVLSHFGLTKEHTEEVNTRNLLFEQDNDDAMEHNRDHYLKNLGDKEGIHNLAYPMDKSIKDVKVFLPTSSIPTEKEIEEEMKAHTDPLPPLGDGWKIKYPNETGLHHWRDFVEQIEEHPDKCKLAIEIKKDSMVYKSVLLKFTRLLIIDFDKGVLILSEKQDRSVSEKATSVIENLSEDSTLLEMDKAIGSARLKNLRAVSTDEEYLHRLELASTETTLPHIDDDVIDIPEHRQKVIKIPHNLLVSLKKVLWPHNQDFLSMRKSNDELEKKFWNTSQSHMILEAEKQKLAQHIFNLLS